eukprot:CAMPEP_0174912254 /NCGR_PEP_ID=MMETSP0167-20121228/79690_1 /TAXON_ID=38298 /ORGANISM="Rhodella maculata, Strain CCMP736" /LENGTH=136 /DNA_ID=CAMNT_0016156899 /DNA_START=22 /DNA_END=432 /DNA_ORIENTATION=+
MSAFIVSTTATPLCSRTSAFLSPATRPALLPTPVAAPAALPADAGSDIEMANRRNLKVEKRQRNFEYARKHRKAKPSKRFGARRPQAKVVDANPDDPRNNDAAFFEQFFTTVTIEAKEDERGGGGDRRGGDRRERA